MNSFLALPYLQVPPLDLRAVGLGRIGVFSITSALSVVVILLVFARLLSFGGDVRRRVGVEAIALMVVGAYMGAYWGQLFFYRPDLLVDDPWLWAKPWMGGYASMGGFYGMLVAGAIYARLRGERALPYLDRGVFAFNMGWVVARTGCALVHDHPGVASDFFLAMRFPDGVVRHDMGLYELLFTLFVLVPLSFFIVRKPWRTGSVLAAICLVYAPVRFLMDFLREGDARYLGLTPAQYSVALMFGLGLWLLLAGRRRNWAMQPPISFTRFFGFGKRR